jgi:plastocyanin domain-containing protein
MKLQLLAVGLLFAGVAAADSPKPPKQTPRFEIAVTRSGFEPGNIAVPAKKPVTLVFTRKTDATCTKSVVVTVDATKKIVRELPLDKPVEVAVTFPKAGTLSYACSMDMNRGVIVVR